MDAEQSFANSWRASPQPPSRWHECQREGFFIECVGLTASTIDGLLRMGLILKHQLDTSSTDLLDQLLHQADEDAVISEREVYRRSLRACIVDQATFDELERLYKERNCVVHRYIISEITTQEVLDTAIRLEEIMRQVTDQVSILEEEQLRLGVGMTRSAKDAVSIVLLTVPGSMGMMAWPWHSGNRRGQRLVIETH